MSDRLIVGSRGSKLALIQANMVAGKLREVSTGLDVQIKKIVTEGDRNLSINIEEAGGVGIFVKAIEDALIKREIDIGVHSLKDLPVVQPEGLCIVAVTEREDPRDALVAASPLRSLNPGARIGTSSVRRSVQIKGLRPDIRTVGIRGNVDTRLRKVASGEVDGIIVAAAAMLRLGREAEITEYFPDDVLIPAAGQGALAIEARCSDTFVADLVRAIKHLPTWQATRAERAFLAHLGGGCTAPISCIAKVDNGLLKMTGMIADREGTVIMTDHIEADSADPEIAGKRLAEKMLEGGAAKIVEEMRCR